MAVGTVIMDANNMVNGSYGEAYATIDGNRYNLFMLVNFEGSVAINKKERGVLGRTGKITYPTGWTGSWKATMSYCTPIFRKLFMEFKSTGKFPSFELQISNENTAGEIGRQTVTYKGCYIDNMILSKLDVEADDTLSEDISGSFNDVEMPEEFGLMNGLAE